MIFTFFPYQRYVDGVVLTVVVGFLSDGKVVERRRGARMLVGCDFHVRVFPDIPYGQYRVRRLRGVCVHHQVHANLFLEIKKLLHDWNGWRKI